MVTPAPCSARSGALSYRCLLSMPEPYGGRSSVLSGGTALTAQPWKEVGRPPDSPRHPQGSTTHVSTASATVGHGCRLVTSISCMYLYVRKISGLSPSDAATQVIRQPAVSTGLLLQMTVLYWSALSLMQFQIVPHRDFLRFEIPESERPEDPARKIRSGRPYPVLWPSWSKLRLG